MGGIKMTEKGDIRTDDDGQKWEAINVESGDNYQAVEWMPVDQ
jgi:hypothetical protein